MAQFNLSGQQNLPPSLEGVQQAHNQAITQTSRVSASNDPAQHKHDANEALIKAAEAAAAGRTLGLSEEETLALNSRKHRRQMLADGRITQQDLSRLRAQRAESISSFGEDGELKGLGYADDTEVDPFGMAQDDEQTFTRQEKVDRNLIPREEMYEDELIRRGDAVDRPVSGNAGVRDALARLEAASQGKNGWTNIIGSVFGNNQSDIARVSGSLEQSLDPGRFQTEADASLGREVARRDAQNFDPFVALLNDQKARREAEQAIAGPYGRLSRQITDEHFERIGRANEAYPQAPAQGLASQTYIGVDGNPIAVQGPNMPDTAQMLNAPSAQNARTWAGEHQPNYREGGRVFGDLQQQDINAATALLSERLRNLDGYGFEGVSPNIRGYDELDRASQAVISRGQAKGDKFYTREPVTDAQGRTKLKNTRSESPGIPEVLNKLRYSPHEAQQLANALFQLEAAKGTTVNQQGKQQYFTRQGPNGTLTPTTFGYSQSPGGAKVFFDSPEGIDAREGQAPVSRIRSGQTIEGRDIGTAFRGLSTPDARQPFIGQVEGETQAGPAYMTRYNKTGETSQDAIASAVRKRQEGFNAKTGKPMDEEDLRQKTVKSQLAQAREDRDLSARADKMSAIIESLPPVARRTRLR